MLFATAVYYAPHRSSHRVSRSELIYSPLGDAPSRMARSAVGHSATAGAAPCCFVWPPNCDPCRANIWVFSSGPDAPEAVTRRNLTRLLTHLRRALPSADLIVTQDDAVATPPESVQTDIAHLRRQGTGDAETALTLDDDVFLDGFSQPECPEFEAWILQERAAFERRYLAALELAIESRAADGLYTDAIDAAQRYLAVDILAEQVQRRLIELYALTGDRGAAQRQYEQCVAVLERELGVDPLPETRAVYEAAMQGEYASAKPAVAAMLAPLPGLHAPLIGRDGALEQLTQAYTALVRAAAPWCCFQARPGWANHGCSRNS